MELSQTWGQNVKAIRHCNAAAVWLQILFKEELFLQTILFIEIFHHDNLSDRFDAGKSSKKGN